MRHDVFADRSLTGPEYGAWVAGQFVADPIDRTAFCVLRIPVSVSYDALERAVRRLLDLHPVLRSAVGSGTTLVRQDVGEPVRSDATARALSETVAADRIAVLRSADGGRQLFMSLPYFAVDRWSIRVIARDLGALCAVGAADTVTAVLPVQDGGTSKADTSNTGSEQDIAYWHAALADIPPVLTLPNALSRPTIASHRTASIRRPLPEAAADALRRLARDLSCEVRDMAFAAFAVVLARLTGQRHLAVGQTFDGRAEAAAHDIVGNLATTVPIPVDLRADPGFADVAEAVRTAVAEAANHRFADLDQVAADVAPARDPSWHPLFQASFAYDDVGAWSAHSAPGAFDVVAAADGPMLTDVHLRIEDDGGFTAVVDYAVDAYPAVTVETVLMCLAELLTSAAAEPKTPVSALGMLPEAERRRLAFDWNAVPADYDPGVCLHELFERQAAATPRSTALTAADRTVNYGELNIAANRLAHLLRARGVRLESHVGVCLDHSVELMSTLLGVLKAGAAYVPLDPAHPAERLKYALDQTRAPVVVTTSDLKALLPPEVEAVCLDETDLASYPTDNPPRTAGPDNLIYTIFTSGSSGRPKGVQISHRGLVNYLLWAIEGYGAAAGEHGSLLVGSIAFDLSIPNIFLPLIVGRDVLILPPERALQALVRQLEGDEDISLLKITPAHLDVLRAQITRQPPLTAVRTYVVGADEVKPDTADQWRRLAPDARVINEYGPTETVVGCSVFEVPADRAAGSIVPIGRPIGNMTMYVLDDHLRPVPVGVVGELWIGGVGVARGYLGRPAATAEKFLPDPFSDRPGARFYRSGDHARMRPDGELEFLGRIDHQVKIRGYRIELGEVEANLLTHPDVSETVVAVREDNPGDKYLAAYFVPRGESGVGRQELRRFLAERLPDYLVPRVYVPLDELPLSPGGKVDRRLLPNPRHKAVDSAGVDARAETDEPDGPVEQALAGHWRKVLGVDTVARTDRFFELGGGRPTAVRAAQLAREAGLPVDARMILQWQTVADLSAYLG
ncbi:amino acid adenylation domain-containing protein [Streptomyces sp. NPDC023838]|uniref:non-ribosomal peptide synthetase n=1 Tax=Streptomyces sp. NPDC023838 TaxID=3154325 RepID=UPI0033D31005